MADNIDVTPGSGATVAADELTDGVLGSCKVQMIKIMDGTLGGTDKAAVTTANGLKVDVSRVLGTVATSDTATLVDDAAFTPGTSRVIPFAALLDNTAPDSVDEGDAGAVRMSANRNLFVNIRDNAGNERGLNVDASGNISVATVTTLTTLTGTTTLTPGTGAANLGKAEDAAHTTGDVGVMALGVSNTNNANLSGATAEYTPISTDLTGAVRSIGKAAHDAAVSTAGEPVLIGLEARDTLTTAVAEADLARVVADRYGRPYAVAPIITFTSAVVTTTGSDVSLISAPGAGLKLVICSIYINSLANAKTIAFKDGTGGAQRFLTQMITSSTVAPSFTNGRWALTANTALYCICTGTAPTFNVTIGYETLAS